mgnify:CR=1 FL=1
MKHVPGEGECVVSGDRAEQLAEFAHLLLYVGRKLSLHTPDHSEVVPLSTLEGVCLEYIHRHPGTTSGDIASHLGLKSSNASAILRSMEAKGMVKREASAKDRRQVSVWLTPLAERSIDLIAQDWVRLLDPLAGDDGSLESALAMLQAIDDGWR